LRDGYEIIRQKGTNRCEFLRGEVDKYSWVDMGSSYGVSDVLMAILYAQIQQLDEIRAKRKIINDFYINNLKKYQEKGIIKSMVNISKECESNYHLFYVILDSEETKDMLINRLKEKGISAVTHFVPLHTSIMGQSIERKKIKLSVTEEVSKSLLRLPMYTGMTKDEMKYVVKEIDEILRS